MQVQKTWVGTSMADFVLHGSRSLKQWEWRSVGREIRWWGTRSTCLQNGSKGLTHETMTFYTHNCGAWAMIMKICRKMRMAMKEMGCHDWMLARDEHHGEMRMRPLGFIWWLCLDEDNKKYLGIEKQHDDSKGGLDCMPRGKNCKKKPALIYRLGNGSKKIGRKADKRFRRLPRLGNEDKLCKHKVHKCKTTHPHK